MLTWDRFTDILPVITLVIGYLGALYSERQRARQELQRSILDRVAALEGQTLLELQDLLDQLPHLAWNAYQLLAQWAEEQDWREEYVTQLLPAAQAAWRARTLATRIDDDELRAEVLRGISSAIRGYTIEDVKAMVIAGKVTPYDRLKAWDAVVRASERIGERLRSPAIARNSRADRSDN
jgi:hypothetical protein